MPGKDVDTSFGTGYDRLAAGELAWTHATVDLFGSAGRPSLPAAKRGTALPGRSPRSKGAYLYTVDRVCGSTDEERRALLDALLTAHRVSAGFRAYGASVCVEFLDPGPAGRDDSAPAAPPEATASA